MMQEIQLPKGSRLIDIPLAVDSRGSLSFATVGREVPFSVQRVFWIHDIPQGSRRGGHSHRTCSEVVVPVSGAFRMVVDDGERRAEVWMDRPNRGILVPAGVWCELLDFQPGTVLVVMASHAYDASGYCHDYSQYIKDKKEER